MRYSRPASVMIEPLPLAIEELDARAPASNALTWWLTAPCVTQQLLGRPRETLMAGRGLEGLQCIQWRQAAKHGPILHEKNSGRVEKRCFAGNRFLVLLVCSSRSSQRAMPNPEQTTCRNSMVQDERPSAGRSAGTPSSPRYVSSSACCLRAPSPLWIVRSRQSRALRELARGKSGCSATSGSPASRCSARPQSRSGAGSPAHAATRGRSCPIRSFSAFPCSTFVHIVRLILTHKGAAYTFRDLETEMGKPSHLALHPFNRVPVLQHDDFTVYETSAIVDLHRRDISRNRRCSQRMPATARACTSGSARSIPTTTPT